MTVLRTFLTTENVNELVPDDCDYVIDCIDSLACKVALVAESINCAALKIASSMGAGNKLDPTRIRVADISKTEVCPLARQMRKRLQRQGILKDVLTRVHRRIATPAAAPATGGPGTSALSERHHQLHAAVIRLHAGGRGNQQLAGRTKQIVRIRLPCCAYDPRLW